MTELDKLVQTWPTDWSEPAGALVSQRHRIGLNQDAFKVLCGQIEDALMSSLGARARNWTILGLAASGGSLFSNARFSEIFKPGRRPAEYLRKAEWVLRHVEEWTARFLPSCATRARSWLEFLRLAVRVKRDEHLLIRHVRATPGVIPIVLGFVEEAFGNYPNQPNSPLIPDKLSSLSCEDLASAASFLLARSNDEAPLTERDLFYQDLSHAFRTQCADYLITAHCLRQVRDLEVSVFRLGYEVTQVSPSLWRIAPPTPQFGMALEFGYVRTKALNLSHQIDDTISLNDVPSFFEFCERFDQDAKTLPGPPLYRLHGLPAPRLQLLIRDDVAKMLAEHVLAKKSMFREEIVHALNACYELFAEPKELWEFEIEPGFTIGRFFTLCRILRFYAVLCRIELSRLRDQDEAAYIRSLVGGGHTTDITTLLTAHGATSFEIDAFMRLSSWSSASDSHVDIQYSPILRAGKNAAFLRMTHVHSNMIRNVFARAKKRIFSDGTRDPLSEEIFHSLQDQVLAAQDVEYTYAGLRGQLDVVAASDDTIFVFECKNTLLPCSSFEQRTLLDHLDKAVDQLDRLRLLWADDGFRRYLASKLRWDLSRVVTLQTVIVPSVRLFSGIQYRGHPVRHARELQNFVRTGTAILRSPDGHFQFDMWEGSPFSGAVLSTYLGESPGLYEAIWDSAHEAVENLQSVRWGVDRVYYNFDVERHFATLSKIYKIVPVPDVEAVTSESTSTSDSSLSAQPELAADDAIHRG
ncbi:hypothetical protein [Sorangium sp. So ce117]|uniref:hypothetical protein n=1 Tax=Sorangium sp. So ce117 TaxID=3133277 RepID=UPI003F60D34F